MPILYIILALRFVLLLIYTPKFALWGLAITLIGFPLYYLAINNKKTPDNLLSE
ncbi:MAG: hypothetical protein WDM71_06040 [Ferruginibacter sp.]